MSLYLKYRPKDFSSLVGQNFIRDTLKNAIKGDKLVGAYLFTGPRGTGKTSSARIFALAMNCLTPKEGNPCGECEICKSFAEGRLIDIIEIDAASNTGVDNVREIIEKAQFTPNRAKYKVYIIDEVHMLSKGAFNALLKILEEPPSHVKFILATTEIQKVPETILSRCQRYDFRSIDDMGVKDRLKFIAQEEGVDMDELSLDYITQNAAGGLRNAINLFEQLIHNEKIEFSYLIEHLGVTSKDTLENFYTKLKTLDTTIIDDYESIVSSGKNIKLFFKDLIFYVKNDIVGALKAGKTLGNSIEILDVLDETYGKTKYALDDTITFLTGILKIITKGTNVSQASAPEIKKTVAAKPTPEAVKPKAEAISEQDVSELFSAPKQEIKTEAMASENFDKEKYLTVLKNIGASGGALAGLKESQMHLSEHSLDIKPQNKFSKIALEKNENLVILQKGLEELGFDSLHINLI